MGCEGGLGCPSWFVILFLCLLVLHLFWGWGGLVTGLWPLLRLLVLDSSDARLHRPDPLAAPSPFVALFLGHLCRPPRPCPSLVLGFRLAPYLQSGCASGLRCPGVCGLRRRSRLPSVLCLLVLHLFWGWGGLVTGVAPPATLSSFAPS